MTFGTEAADQGGYYDPTLSRYTPPAGTVTLLAGVYLNGATPGGLCTLSVYKNGASIGQKVYYASAGGDIGMDTGTIDVCDGTDYYEIFVYAATGATAMVTSHPTNTFFRGMVA